MLSSMKMNKSKIILFLFLVLSTTLSVAQEGEIRTLEQNDIFYKAIEFEVKANTFYTHIDPDFRASSISFETSLSNTLQRAYVLLGGTQKFLLRKDIHNTQALEDKASRAGHQSTELYIAPGAFQFFSFFSGDLSGTMRVNLLYAPPLENDPKKTESKKKVSLKDCSVKPVSIDQSVWRQGLPDPKGSPVQTSVKHLILHHAAGSNSETNYTAVVRNYYLLHTQTNNWDDIGYNFLVAQDGTIYDGRDGRELMEDDNVLGAHMCARNTQTMGICLLGNYDVNGVFPTDTSLASIEKLLVWKLHKEHLNPLDSLPHPSAGMLGTIAGHKEGCAAGYTKCPGDNYFAMINGGMKERVNDSLMNCEALGYTRDLSSELISIYPNPTDDYFSLRGLVLTKAYIQIINTQGRVLKKLTFDSLDEGQQIETRSLPAGIYVVWIHSDQGNYSYRLQINPY